MVHSPDSSKPTVVGKILLIALIATGVLVLQIGTVSNASRLLTSSFPISQATVDSQLQQATPELLQIETWPHSPPNVKSKSSCRVKFVDDDMALCHMVPWGANFGDEIGPAIAKRILEHKFGCSAEDVPILDLFKTKPIMERPADKRCLYTVGSLWSRVRNEDHVWGIGSYGERKNYCSPENNVTDVTVYSVRGPGTANGVKSHCNVTTPMAPLLNSTYGFEPAGDPGFLIPFLFPEYKYSARNATKDYCFIPHHYDEGGWNWKEYPKSHILKVQQSWESMVTNMMDCKLIISSSLHGIILSDAFGIPVHWMRVKTRVQPFKFNDYYAALPETHRRPKPMPIAWTKDAVASGKRQDPVKKMIHGKKPDPIPLDKRMAIADRIVKTFPIHLFTTEGEDPSTATS